MGGAAAPPPAPPPPARPPPRIFNGTLTIEDVIAASQGVNPSSDIAGLELLALVAIPLIVIFFCIWRCSTNKKKWSELQGTDDSEAFFNGPREYPPPTAYVELKSGLWKARRGVDRPLLTA